MPVRFHRQKKEACFRGIAASPGVSFGPVFIFLQKELEVPIYQIDKTRHDEEIQRFQSALIKTREQIAQVRAKVANKLGENEAKIFDSHLLVLEDQALIQETIDYHNEHSCNIDYCFHIVAKRYISEFSHINDEYIRERVTDIRDVSRRLLHNLLGQDKIAIGYRLTTPSIILSEDLTPSDAASFSKDRVLGIVTDSGSRTSHSVIMARSLRVPAVVGLHDISWKVEDGDQLLIDGYEGLVFLNPSQKTLQQYGKLEDKHEHRKKVFLKACDVPTQTKDKKPIRLLANIEGLDDVDNVLECQAGGVGLLRTESLYLRGEGFPSEEQQFEIYRTIVSKLTPRPVTIRTLDLGGDKRLKNYAFVAEEENPFMGFRAIRFCLEHKELFKEQLRAILRSSAYGVVKILYPMISSEMEMIQANQVLEEARAELRLQGIRFDENIPIGCMIEIPGAVYIADRLAKHAQFFSVGTNDLIQYLLAVDRINDRIAHLYQPNHPAVLRALVQIVESAKKSKTPVSVCGEMAGDPLYAPFLVGLGIQELSINPVLLPEIKYLLASADLAQLKKLAKQANKMVDPNEILQLFRKFYADHMGTLSL
ncbi:MAG: phosphoenolpyruvate--protein phosphotransferase [Verrucomicrobia bacterium GWF2_51_19]|nr:MAG: phosphoenolpyruvate--protein phosphotransferase [Verrucomicrobia bacterium GWF2_51_19]HCJ11493.1 phosphoenolpyruvate--protein phosphotransferase [Opitutae bacterium]